MTTQKVHHFVGMLISNSVIQYNGKTQANIDQESASGYQLPQKLSISQHCLPLLKPEIL